MWPCTSVRLHKNIHIIWLTGVLNYLWAHWFCLPVWLWIWSSSYLQNRQVFFTCFWEALLFFTFSPEACRWPLIIIFFLLFKNHSWIVWKFTYEKIRFYQCSWMFMRTLCCSQIERYYLIMTLENKSSCTYYPAQRPPALSDSKALWHPKHRALHCLDMLEAACWGWSFNHPFILKIHCFFSFCSFLHFILDES